MTASILLFADNASSSLATGIADTDTSLTVQTSTGALFSDPSSGQYALGTLEDVSGNIEIVQITVRTGDTFTIVRAQEGTAALAFASGTIFEQRVTAGMLALFLQKTGSDNLSGTTGLSGVLSLGDAGSIQGGEIAGTAVRSSPGDTSNEFVVPIGEDPTIGGSVVLTEANITSNLPDGVGVNVTGMILFWSGASDAIPTGYVLCDGTNSTPDLRDQFIVGGGGALPTTGTYGSTTGASASVPDTISGTMLGLSDLPSHLHPFDYFDGNGGAVIYVPGGGPGPDYIFGGSGPGTKVSFAGSPQTGAGTNAHTHTATSGGTHTHTVSAPPYTAVFAIMKT